METILKSKVYVKTDNQDCITSCEGGYTTPSDLEGWTQIDKGTGDKYNLCQSHYFDDGLYTVDGVPRYKLVDGQPVERTEEEIQADRPDALVAEKAAHIQQSKDDLEVYLEAHPITWTDGKQYSITREKQNQLMGTIAAAQIDGQPPEWNTTGGVCRAWDLTELCALAVAIKDRVKALVKYQQAKEVAMREAATLEELEGVNVDYGEVS